MTSPAPPRPLRRTRSHDPACRPSGTSAPKDCPAPAAPTVAPTYPTSISTDWSDVATTIHTLSGRRAAAEKKASRSVSFANYETVETIVRVVASALPLVLFGITLTLSFLLPSPWSNICDVLVIPCLTALLMQFVWLLSYESLAFFTMPGLVERFPHREQLLDQLEAERALVRQSSEILELTAKVTKPDALGTWGRLSELDLAIERIATEGQSLYSKCCRLDLPAEVRSYALDALEAYETVMTPSVISDAVRRFTGAYHESKIGRWSRKYEPEDLAEPGFIEMHLRVQCKSNLDWALLNEYYLAGSQTLDARTAVPEEDPGTTSRQEFFLNWWRTGRERRLESLPFDLVLLYVPYCITKAQGWALEAEIGDYPVSLAPRTPVLPAGAPVEYVTKLWSNSSATWSASYKPLDRVVSAARRITK